MKKFFKDVAHALILEVSFSFENYVITIYNHYQLLKQSTAIDINEYLNSLHEQVNEIVVNGQKLNNRKFHVAIQIKNLLLENKSRALFIDFLEKSPMGDPKKLLQNEEKISHSKIDETSVSDGKEIELEGRTYKFATLLMFEYFQSLGIAFNWDNSVKVFDSLTKSFFNVTKITGNSSSSEFAKCNTISSFWAAKKGVPQHKNKISGYLKNFKEIENNPTVFNEQIRCLALNYINELETFLKSLQ